MRPCSPTLYIANHYLQYRAVLDYVRQALAAAGHYASAHGHDGEIAPGQVWGRRICPQHGRQGHPPHAPNTITDCTCCNGFCQDNPCFRPDDSDDETRYQYLHIATSPSRTKAAPIRRRKAPPAQGTAPTPPRSPAVPGLRCLDVLKPEF